MRLALAYAGIFSVVAVVAAAALWLALSRTEYSAIDDSLASSARVAESALLTLGTPPAAGDSVLPPPSNGDVPVGELVFSRTGTVLQRTGDAPSSSALAAIAVQAIASKSSALSTQTIDGESRRILATRVDLRSGDSVVVIVMRSLTEANRLLLNATFTGVSSWTCLPTSWGSWPTPSTACSRGWKRLSRACDGSPPTPPTSCARR